MKEDWRLTNQKQYLDEVTLTKTKYYSDVHTHCEFCWNEFYKGDIGYTTYDKYHWICTNCFDDFKKIFRWKVDN